MTENIKKPSWFLNLTEGFRSFFEFLSCLYFLAFYKYTKQGNGQPVMVVPGLLGSDTSTGLLRKFITKLGYIAYGWGLGRNLGNMEDLKLLTKKIEDIHQKHQQKVILIGWSLGGIYVRELAKANPEWIAQIFTLGSPFANLDAPNHAKWVFNLFNDMDKIDPVLRNQIPNHAAVPTTAIYSKQDGIVPWQACMEQKEDDWHKNIEVSGSHFGFTMNTAVFEIIKKSLPQ